MTISIKEFEETKETSEAIVLFLNNNPNFAYSFSELSVLLKTEKTWYSLLCFITLASVGKIRHRTLGYEHYFAAKR